MTQKKPILPLWMILIPIILGLGFVFAGQVTSVQASPPLIQTTPIPGGIPMSNAECLECHAAEDMLLPLSSGEVRNLTIDIVQFNMSPHENAGYSCVQCHTDITGFPHPETDYANAREITAYMSQSCSECHEPEYQNYSEGAHAAFQSSGKLEAATCGDCHNPHGVETFKGSRTAIVKACEQCHVGIYDQYEESVHGDALLEDYNLDVPSCIDCHDHHKNAGPTKEGFHLNSPQVCAQCHTDESLMNKYGINTNVFDTFVADFHGTTVTIFEKTAPDQETNKAVCIDCHGAHDIKSPDDAGSTVIKQNILTTCQRCHPGATPNFSDSWLSHYPPDAEHHLPVYIVNVFYQFFIPGVLGFMAIFIGTDIWRSRIRPLYKGQENHE
jgi:hypothetical protein